MIEKHLTIHPIAFLVIDATFFFSFRQVPMVVWCVSAKIHSRINPHYFVKLVVDGREKKTILYTTVNILPPIWQVVASIFVESILK